MCDIPNCAACNDVGSECMQCQGGFQQNTIGVGCTGEPPMLHITITCQLYAYIIVYAEMSDDDDLETGVVIGIIAAICVMLLILIILIIAIVVSCHRRRKRRNFV